MTAAGAPPMPPASLSTESFAQFSQFITRELGIKMPPEKLPMLESRLLRRMRQLGLSSVAEYQEQLFQLPESDPEWTEFINLVTTNKTDFFREAVHFEYLVRSVVPAWAERASVPQKFNVWCAGCSSGEEPYTLAMVLSEEARSRSGFDFSILATDISTRVLEQARNAIYPERTIEPVPLGLRQRYLLRSKDRHRPTVRIVPELREKVRFGRLNFMEADYGVREHFHTIFFRNVMIYFDKQTQEQVLQKLCRQLHPGGFLFVGHSESLVGLSLPIKQVATAAFVKLP